MSLSNNSPVSAFVVYKNKKSQKVKPVHTLSDTQQKSRKVNGNVETKKIDANKSITSNIHKKKRKVQKKIDKNLKKNIKSLSSLAQKGFKQNGLGKNNKITLKRKVNKHNSLSKVKDKIKNYEKISAKQKHRFVRTIQNENDDDEEAPTLIPIDTTNYNTENECNLAESISQLTKTDPTPDCLKLFKWFIAPLSASVFFEKFWETEALFIKRDSSTYYNEIFTTQRLDNIFREFPLYYTRNVDVVSYENGRKESHNEEGRVVASALYDYYSNGCSIRILNPHTYDQKIHLLISTLQEYFGTMVGANIYLTPPGSQGFAPHYDDIEAFVIQLEGRKHWKLYKPKGSDILARDSSPNLKHEDIGEPFMEVTLNAGDLLYFPRGTIHEGRTGPDAHSFHITVSVYQHNSYADLLEKALPVALKKAALEDVEFRKGLPLNYLKHTGHVNKGVPSKGRKRILDNVEKLVDTLKSYVDVDQAADQLGRKFMYDSMPPVLSKHEVRYTSKYDGDYMKDGNILNRVEIGMDTEIRLLRYFCLRLVVDEDSPKIYYNTENAKYYHGEEEQFLIIDHSMIPCIKRLQRTYPKFIEVEKLPIEDNIAKAQLVSDLWERGLLVTNGPLPSVSDEDSGDEDDGDENYSEESD